MEAYINHFDFTDKIFLTLAIVILFTCLMYKFTVQLGKPMIIGGIVSGLIISHLPLPVKYFNIESCTLVGNIGIVLFVMFIGSEFNFRRLLTDKTNIVIPFVLILTPFILGVLTYPLLLKLNLIDPYGERHKILVAIFIGIAVSMSTFSILVMLINNTFLKFSRVGKLAVFCAAFEEAIFWIMLAIVLAYFQQNAYMSIAPTIYLGVYIVFLIFVMPFIIKVITNMISTKLTMLGFIIGGCLLSAVVADIVNLHPIFGGFVFGLLLPRNNNIINQLREQLLEFIVIILLPIYFVKTGIEASTSLSFDESTIIISIIFIIISFVGKYGSALIVGKTWHFSNKEVLILGSLLSIRGTMEIALLNIGKEVGLLAARTYSALVVMSVITTWIATSISLRLYKKVEVNE